MEFIKRSLRLFDIYGVPVAQLNIKGRSQFTSACGGMLGLTVTMLLLWFMVIKID